MRKRTVDEIMGAGSPHAQKQYGDSGYTNAEAQMIKMEQSKSRIRDRVKPDVPMYQKEAFTSQLAGGLDGAKQRQTSGTMSMDDALALGVRRSRYGDFGSVREERPDTRMVQGMRGYGMEDKTRMVSRDRSAEEWLQSQNQPALDTVAAEKAMLAEGVKAGTLVPQMDAAGNISGYAPRQEPSKDPKFINTGHGVFDPTTMQMVDGTAPPAKPAEAPVQTMGPKGPAVKYGDMIGFWDPKLGDYSGWKIPSAGEEVRDPSTGEVIFSRGGGDYSALPSYQDESATPASAIDGLDVDGVVQKIIASNPGMTPEEAHAKALELGYIK